jgi:hypothetical protein
VGEPVASPELEPVESAVPAVVAEDVAAENATPKKKRAARKPRAAEKAPSTKPAKKRTR